MATPKSQRIGIWIITIVLAVGTLGSFAIIGLSIENQGADQILAQQEYEDYLAQWEQEQKEQAELRAKTSEPLSGYSARKFDAESVKKLKVEVLKQGSGQKVASDDSVSVSYFGWLSDGTIFDSSKQQGVDDEPILLSLQGVIEGWTEGLDGIKVGSVVRLTIPSDQAYGSSGSGIIPEDAPLEFIVQIHAIDNSTDEEA